MDGCWRCGAPWRCSKCGSFERRTGGKGCAECHRRRARERAQRTLFDRLLLDDFEDVEITPAVRIYIAAFDKYLKAGRDGDPVALRAATDQRRAALDVLEGPVNVAPA